MLRAALAVALLLVGTALADNPKKPAPPPAGKMEDRVVARINECRKLAGLEPVALDSELSKACAAHAKFLALNDDWVWKAPLRGHQEDPKLPGYTPQGEKAGQHSDIGWQEPPEALEQHIGSLFHRVPILDPKLRKIGVGRADGGKYGVVSVIDISSGVDEAVASNRLPGGILYPADKQTGVPLEYDMSEQPDPIPADTDRKAGYPITCSFASEKSVKQVRTTLKDRSGKELEAWVSTPEKPADPAYQGNTVCLFPKDPLRPNETYSVTVTCELDRKPWSRTWTFTTAAK